MPACDAPVAKPAALCLGTAALLAAPPARPAARAPACTHIFLPPLPPSSLSHVNPLLPRRRICNHYVAWQSPACSLSVHTRRKLPACFTRKQHTFRNYRLQVRTRAGARAGAQQTSRQAGRQADAKAFASSYMSINKAGGRSKGACKRMWKVETDHICVGSGTRKHMARAPHIPRHRSACGLGDIRHSTK